MCIGSLYIQQGVGTQTVQKDWNAGKVRNIFFHTNRLKSVRIPCSFLCLFKPFVTLSDWNSTSSNGLKFTNPLEISSLNAIQTFYPPKVEHTTTHLGLKSSAKCWNEGIWFIKVRNFRNYFKPPYFPSSLTVDLICIPLSVISYEKYPLRRLIYSLTSHIMIKLWILFEIGKYHSRISLQACS